MTEQSLGICPVCGEEIRDGYVAYRYREPLMHLDCAPQIAERPALP